MQQKHPIIHFFTSLPPASKTKKVKKKTEADIRADISLFLVLEGDGELLQN